MREDIRRGPGATPPLPPTPWLSRFVLQARLCADPLLPGGFSFEAPAPDRGSRKSLVIVSDADIRSGVNQLISFGEITDDATQFRTRGFDLGGCKNLHPQVFEQGTDKLDLDQSGSNEIVSSKNFPG